MQYADALALSVKNKEMTEAEALRRFAGYKSQMLYAVRKDQTIFTTGVAANASR